MVVSVVDFSKLSSEFEAAKDFKSSHKSVCIVSDDMSRLEPYLQSGGSVIDNLEDSMKAAFATTKADTVICDVLSPVSDIAARIAKSMDMKVVRVAASDKEASLLSQDEQVDWAKKANDADEFYVAGESDDMEVNERAKNSWMKNRADAALLVTDGSRTKAYDFGNDFGAIDASNPEIIVADVADMHMRSVDAGGVIVAMTGHRPDKLFEYNMKDPRYDILRDELNQKLDELGATTLITGMALGFDQLAAEVALDRGMRVVAAVPCENQDAKWIASSKREYKNLLDKVDDCVLVSDGTFMENRDRGNDCMQERNKWMVDHADSVIACWDGSRGGTGNCVNYAKSKGVAIERINPKDIQAKYDAQKSKDMSDSLSKSSKKRVGVVGLLPNDMFGYNMNDEHYAAIREDIGKKLDNLGADTVIVSAEQGYARLAGEVALEKGLDVVCVKPFADFDAKWPKPSKKSLADFEAKCRTSMTVSGSGFGVKKLFDADRTIMDASDSLLIATDGKTGRPENAIRYARKEKKPFVLADKDVLLPSRQKDVTDKSAQKSSSTSVSKSSGRKSAKESVTNNVVNDISFDALFSDSTKAQKKSVASHNTKGDVSLVHDAVLIQQVNCQGAIGAGVSGAIINKWPEVKDKYIEYCASRTPDALHGSVLAVPVDDNVIVCNAFTQLDYGNAARTGKVYTDEDKLVAAIRGVCDKYSDKPIVVPENIGCGLAGGNWDSVLSRIEDLPINIVSYEPGVEPRLVGRETPKSNRDFSNVKTVDQLGDEVGSLEDWSKE